VVTPRGDEGVDADVVDGSGRVLVALRGYRTILVPMEDEAATPQSSALS
jgi:hypothetical protein